jgi:hypothetical protein
LPRTQNKRRAEGKRPRNQSEAFVSERGTLRKIYRHQFHTDFETYAGFPTSQVTV